ncbi:RES family NAD+ phosphorylase [Deefgea tanakiae]|uniref:RES family NAD+ phosphorylase n=1 Tax=Deefgea tanakiae TaxID=2865840 RepID=A0ABX8Z5C0_9NEIS|nr:RES family NAD+ phosphorylase [Deefgea tanakiae]QZA76380.1 RES family NAD+ phosphorylase [Deefgea tanakiae]
MPEVEYEDKYWFEELFYRDVESWMSADIACCDHCYDDFLASWPLAYGAEDAKFQCNSIDMDSFYSGSRLQDCYTKDEFDYFIKKIECPRCGSPLKYNIWCYELPFMVDPEFEQHAVELDRVRKETPFLLLTNPFAQKVHTAICELGSTYTPEIVLAPLFRARAIDPKVKTEWLATEFSYPPKEYVGEGRYNHAGLPALYLASDAQTCFYELRNVDCMIAKLTITQPLKILDLTREYGRDEEEHESLFSTLAYSAFMSARQDETGWHKPMYVFTRFVRDCALQAGFDAIKYHSTRSNSSFNIVLLSDNSVPLESIVIEEWSNYPTL